ncbi:hypothetical protein CWC28_21540, partial [Pseudoalteromonas sp. S4492]|uniref:DUF4115 domain-containing protein n=1 Tax=Pseudoalteromonas sp. S4492 TaxID=579560 RepID=UPI00127D6DE7
VSDEELLPAQIDFDDSDVEVTDPEPESQVDSMSEEAEEPGLADSLEAEPEMTSAVVLNNAESLPEVDSSLVSLAIQFAEDCWVQIKDMSGNSLYTDVQRAGSN